MKVIANKICHNCKEEKPMSEFNKNKARKGGYAYDCKICMSIWNKKYHQTEQGKQNSCLASKRYHQTEKGQKAQKQYRQKYKFKQQARMAVNNAVQAGKLPHADSFKCSCGKQARHYHHYLGYEKEHWFDIRPVCKSCDYKLHLNTIEEIKK